MFNEEREGKEHFANKITEQYEEKNLNKSDCATIYQCLAPMTLYNLDC